MSHGFGITKHPPSCRRRNAVTLGVSAMGTVGVRSAWIDGAPRTGRDAARRLVVVPRHPEGLCDPLVLHRRLEDHAFGELVDHRALDLLPGALARGIREAAPRLEIRPPAGEFLGGQQDVGTAAGWGGGGGGPPP